MSDTPISQEAEKLQKLTVYGRWLFVLICWLTLAPFGIWEMRETIMLCKEHCTWAAIRYGLQFNPVGGFALVFSVAITTSVLIWQSSHILQGGLSDKEIYYLEKQVEKIRATGPKHILYSWICKNG